MKIIAIIPVRMGSTRLPGKPLLDILGLSMVEHVRVRTKMSSVIDDVIVATCDQEIIEEVERSGGKAVLTSSLHTRCTDRIAEAAENLDADIIINVQGDEPLLYPEMFESLIAPLIEDDKLVCSNMASVIHSEQESIDENVVKVVCNRANNIIYFSRESIPSNRKYKNGGVSRYKQLGLIAFRRDFLIHFTKLQPTPLEIIESIDMLRAIEYGYQIRMVETASEVVGIDTPEDLERVKILMKRDSLFSAYSKKT